MVESATCSAAIVSAVVSLVVLGILLSPFLLLQAVSSVSRTIAPAKSLFCSISVKSKCIK